MSSATRVVAPGAGALYSPGYDHVGQIASAPSSAPQTAVSGAAAILGIGFEFFDVADFRARKSPQAPAANPDPGRERFQYLAGWVNFVLWMVLAGILVLNSDVLLAVFWFLIGRHF